MSALLDGQTILFTGDSITDCGRRGDAAPLGNGYVALFRELMTARYPERCVNYLNKGIGGNIVSDLENRWDDDVARHKPDWLSVKVGINDLHGVVRQADGAITPERFEAGYASLMERTFAHWQPNVVLVSPFFISTDRSGGLRTRVLELLPSYIDVVRRMAERFGTKFVDLQQVFERHLQFREPDDFCPEPVHPSRAGHLVIASEIMAALEE
jgi:lysophospholipase L1-like esterase